MSQLKERNLREVLQKLRNLDQKGSTVYLKTCVYLLQSCSDIKSIRVGKQVHAYLLNNTIKPDVIILNNLINMYVKCMTMGDACQVFDKMPIRDEFTWTTIIGGYTRHKNGGNALKLFVEMRLQDVKFDKVTFVKVLNACSGEDALGYGKLMHAIVLKMLPSFDVFVGSSLVGMYAKCGTILEAERTFETLLVRDVIAWNIIISGYVQYGYGKKALDLFTYMQDELVKPDAITFITILSACGALTVLGYGKQVHATIIRYTSSSDSFIDSSLVDMYAKCASIKDAHQVFDKMLLQDTVSWSIMIAGYAQNGCEKTALKLFQQMHMQNVDADRVTFISILNACANIHSLELGKHIHAHILLENKLLSEVSIHSTLIDMYCKCGSIEKACELFNNSCMKDDVSCSAMAVGYTQLCLYKEALELFKQLKLQGVEVSVISYPSLLGSCGSMASLEQGKWVHSDILKSGYDLDVFLLCALIDMYSKCGNMSAAFQVFSKMPVPDLASWNVIIAGYLNQQDAKDALRFFAKMQLDGVKPDNFTFVSILGICSAAPSLERGRWMHANVQKGCFEIGNFVGNALIDMYAKTGSLKDAQQVFDKLVVQDVVSWSVMICGYAQHGQSSNALAMFKEMQHECVKPNKITFSNIVNACGAIAALEHGKWAHSYILKSSYNQDLLVNNTLIDMYAKCGRMEVAQNLFDIMIARNIVSWNAMISGFAQHGSGMEAILLYNRMLQEGTEPDEITFTSVLSACRHAYLLDSGCFHFILMSEGHGIVQMGHHYACLIDLLGRLGGLDELREIVNGLAFIPSLEEWKYLLGACPIYGSLELAEYSIQKAFVA